IKGEWYTEKDPGYVVTDNYYAPNQITVTVDTSGLNTKVGGEYFVYYRAVDQSGNLSKRVFRKVTVNFATGLKQIGANETMALYPNPTSGLCTVLLSTKEEGSIEIYNIVGTLIKNVTYKSNQTQIDLDLSDEKPGMYFVVMKAGGKKKTTKIQLIK
ncbi:MAG: T9SS type A sorting domain-containing protein, partial [Bacteroidota bacterium]